MTDVLTRDDHDEWPAATTGVSGLVADLHVAYDAVCDPYEVPVDQHMAAEYAPRREPAWVSSRSWAGEMALAVRRPESLVDTDLDAWWHDLKSWATWAIGSFRLARTFPPCWPQHAALVEELMALWMLWQSGWLPAKEPSSASQFLQQLDLSMSRCGRLWQVSCDPAGPHKNSPDAVAGAEGEPLLHRWWGNDYYIEGVRQ